MDYRDMLTNRFMVCNFFSVYIVHCDINCFLSNALIINGKCCKTS